MIRLKLPRRLVHNRVKASIHEITSIPEASVLSNNEKEELARFPFFSYCELDTSKRRINKEKQQYLNEKLPIVKNLFGEDPKNPGYLNYSLPKGMSNPYQDAIARYVINPETGEYECHGVPRLSVTKLLTKRWCELREAYDIYAKIPIYEHPQVQEGLTAHQRLEDETHPISEEWQTFAESFEIEIPSDDFHELAGSWLQSMIKMTNLFIDGQAREVLCHGYLDSRSGQLIDSSVKDEEDITVSGIIDHLILKQKSSASIGSVHDITPTRLGNVIIDDSSYDISEVLNNLKEARPYLRETYEVVVSDVKTRSIRKIPGQNSVLKATKLQVMYYRYFLETLAADPSSTYEKLLLNAQRRRFDVDKPINPAKLISMMAGDDIITSDMRRLKNGDTIGFAPFDDFYSDNIVTTEYDMSNFYELLTDVRVIEKYEEFFTLWAKPVTLRYFAARLAQIYHEVGSLLSDQLMVEYYNNGDNFYNIMFEYDFEKLQTNCFDSAMFLFGKRDIDPIKPNLKNFLTYCKYCDYEDVCSWKRNGSEMCRGLGGDLAKVAETDSDDLDLEK